MVRSLFSSRYGGRAEGSGDAFDECALFPEDKPAGLGFGEVGAAFGVRFEAGAVGFVRGQADKSDQRPGNVVRAFQGQEIADEMAAAAGNDAAPVFGVLLESFALERIDLIADEAGYAHRGAP